MKKMILIGAGGHCKVVIDAILSGNEFEIAGIIDAHKKKGDIVSGVRVIGKDRDLPAYYKKGVSYCMISIGSVGDPRLRVKIAGLAKEIGFVFPNIVHPRAIIASSLRLGVGNFVAPGVVVNSDVILGDFCILNTASVIDHDCVIGDYSHIAPSVTLGGSVYVGARSHVGSGSTVIQGIRIGKDVMIGSGSVVIDDVDDNAVAFGVPCKMMRFNKGNRKSK